MNTPATVPLHPCGSDHTPKRVVLLVEDEPFVREATSRILQSAGFEVLVAGDASEAIDLFERGRRPIDLLMSDLVLPGRSGRQLGEDLRRRSPQLPVLLTSGYLEIDCASDSPDTHTYFLQKPYSRSEVVRKMETILDSVPRQRAARQAG